MKSHTARSFNDVAKVLLPIALNRTLPFAFCANTRSKCLHKAAVERILLPGSQGLRRGKGNADCRAQECETSEEHVYGYFFDL